MKNLQPVLFFTIIIFSVKGQLNSPCPNIFRYSLRGNEIIGFLRIPASTQTLEYIVEFRTTVGVKISSNYYGKIEQVEKSWEVACAAIREGFLQYSIYFPLQSPLPIIESIIVNGVEICSGPKATGLYVTSMFLQHKLKLNCPHNFAYVPPSFQNTPPWILQQISTTPRTTTPWIVTRRTTTQRPIYKPQYTSAIEQNPGSSDYEDYANTYEEQDNTIFHNNKICGKREQSAAITPLIVHGRNTKRGEYPWLVALYHKDLFTCGGNLISNEHILTAAHCITEREDNINDFLVVLGINELKNSLNKDTIQAFPKQIFTHPHYRQFSEDRADGDIAIIVIKPIQFTRYIRPICLYYKLPDVSTTVGHIAKVAGWGSDEDGNNITKQIRDVDVRIVSKETCASNKDLKKLLTPRTFCAGGRGKGPCTGDSGGGIILPIDETNKQFYLRGLVSASLKDPFLSCDVNNYAIYVDIAKFIPWIVEKCKHVFT